MPSRVYRQYSNLAGRHNYSTAYSNYSAHSFRNNSSIPLLNVLGGRRSIGLKLTFLEHMKMRHAFSYQANQPYFLVAARFAINNDYRFIVARYRSLNQRQKTGINKPFRTKFGAIVHEVKRRSFLILPAPYN